MRAQEFIIEGAETKVGRRNETHDWAWYSMGKDGKWKYGGAARTKQQAQAKAQEYSSKQGVAEQQLDELSFLGSEWTAQDTEPDMTGASAKACVRPTACTVPASTKVRPWQWPANNIKSSTRIFH